MQWDASPHAGFTTGTPWIAVNSDYPQVNAAAQVDDPGSVFSHYRRLIALRHDEPAVAHGDFTMLLPDDDAVYAFTRRYGDVELLVLGNFTGDDVGVEIDGWHGAELLLGNYPDDAGPLRPWEARVYRARESRHRRRSPQRHVELQRPVGEHRRRAQTGAAQQPRDPHLVRGHGAGELVHAQLHGRLRDAPDQSGAEAPVLPPSSTSTPNVAVVGSTRRRSARPTALPPSRVSASTARPPAGSTSAASCSASRRGSG